MSCACDGAQDPLLKPPYPDISEMTFTAIGVSPLRHSIVRRSAGVTAAFLFGHAFNYAMMLAANWILGAGSFGIFYTTVLIITVVMSPMVGITVVMSRRLADVNAAEGNDQVLAITRSILGLCARWGIPGVITIGVMLALSSRTFGIEAWQVMMLIPPAVLALISVEVMRASFQSMLLFSWSSVLWVVSQATQFALAIAGLLLIGKVWAGIAGILAGAALASLVFGRWFQGRSAPTQASLDTPQFVGIAQEIPMIASYSFFILFNNIDILLAYVFLPRSALDFYAASALLPKAIITSTFPIAQVVLPVIVEQKTTELPIGLSVVKAVGMVVVSAAAISAILWFAVPLIQKSALAVRGLDFDTMVILSVGAIGLSTLRILVVVELAVRRYIVGVSQVIAVLLFVIACFYIHPSLLSIAKTYTLMIWIWVLLVAVATLPLIAASRRRNGKPV